MEALARTSGYTGLTLAKFCDRWTFVGNTDKLKNMISICAKQGLIVTADTIVDLNSWTETDVQKFLTANSRSEGWELAGDQYFENDANLPAWALDLFSRRWSNLLELVLTPNAEAGAQVKCNDPKTPDQDPPNITFMVACTAIWGTSTSPADFPKDSQLTVELQDIPDAKLKIFPRFRGHLRSLDLRNHRPEWLVQRSCEYSA